ncbi:hypothetical protein PILCRDRAFT_74565, partial [Piloderma croceum F 1598]
ESCVLFDSVINSWSRWFTRTSVIPFLNKITVFESKRFQRLPQIYHIDKYFSWHFMQANYAWLTIYPHLTQETNSTIVRLAFATVKETILQITLKDLEMLWLELRWGPFL